MQYLNQSQPIRRFRPSHPCHQRQNRIHRKAKFFINVDLDIDTILSDFFYHLGIGEESFAGMEVE
jgi:hypothetical protein